MLSFTTLNLVKISIKLVINVLINFNKLNIVYLPSKFKSFESFESIIKNDNNYIHLSTYK